MVRSGRVTAQRPWCRSKKANSGSLQLPDLTFHHAYFEPTVEILSSWIKGWIFFPIKTRLPSSTTPINWGGFHGLSIKKIGSKLSQKPALPWFLADTILFLSPPWPSTTTTLSPLSYPQPSPPQATTWPPHVVVTLRLPLPSTVSSSSSSSCLLLRHKAPALPPPSAKPVTTVATLEPGELPFPFFFFFFLLLLHSVFTTWIVDKNYNSRPLFM